MSAIDKQARPDVIRMADWYDFSDAIREGRCKAYERKGEQILGAVFDDFINAWRCDLGDGFAVYFSDDEPLKLTWSED